MKKLLVGFFLLIGVPAFGAVSPELIQLQQQQQLDAEARAREIENIASQSPYVTGAIAPTVAPTDDIAAGHCVNIKTIVFGGNTILSDRQIRKITSGYENCCLNINEINQMLNDITNVYIERGYATSRAFMEMPQTRLSDGILDIYIIQGKINKIEGLGGGERVTAFPWLSGRVLNIRDIEQGLDQMNRLGSNRASMDVRATPDADAISDIVIKNETGGQVHLASTFDNYGTESTGEWRAGVRGTIDNLMGLNDQINLSLSNSLVDDMGHRVSRSAMMGLSVPLGYWTFSNNFSYSYYKTSFPMPVSGDRFFTLGDSFTNTLSIDRILLRGQTYKLGATASLTYKKNENNMRVYDLETRNDASSRSLTLLNFDVPLTLYFPRGMVYVKPGLTQGLRIFDAPNDDASPYAQRAQYTAFKLYAHASWNFGWGSVSSSVDAQYSHDELYSTESFYIGGNSSVRGFHDDSSTGDSGFSLRNDLDLNLGQIFATDNRWVRAFSPGVFIDFGMTFPNAAYRDNAVLAGGGVKLGFKYWLIDASATYGQIIARENWMSEDYSVYLYVGLSGRF